MSEIPEELKYTKTHEWVRTLDDGHFEIGITDHAQDMMGDMVFVELPEVGTAVGAGEDCAVVESVKAASDVYAPVGGEVVEINSELGDAPETINQDPYQRGWMFRLRPSDQSETANLLDAKAYEQVVASDS
jgi:glycine cleavage system H protein